MFWINRFCALTVVRINFALTATIKSFRKLSVTVIWFQVCQRGRNEWETSKGPRRRAAQRSSVRFQLHHTRYKVNTHNPIIRFFPYLNYFLLSSLLGLDCYNVGLSPVRGLLLRNVVACRAYFIQVIWCWLTLSIKERQLQFIPNRWRFQIQNSSDIFQRIGVMLNAK